MKEIWSDMGDLEKESGLDGIRWLIPISLVGLLVVSLLCLVGIF